MADTFGSIKLPVAVTTPAGDPALLKVGRFIQAVVNAYCSDAWNVVFPRPDRAPAFQAAIAEVFTHNPEELRGESFNDKMLPALYIWRENGEFEHVAEDWDEHHSQWRAQWVMASDAQAKQILRRSMLPAIGKAIRAALHQGIHPDWVDDGDTGPNAASVAADPDSVKLAVSTSVSAQTYAGAALDGVRAGSTFSPRLQPTVTTTEVDAFDDPGFPDLGDEDLGVVEVYNTTDPIVWTCIDWYDREVTRSAYLTLPLGGETVGPPEDVKRVVSVHVPAQLSTIGTLTFGTGAATGRGSDLGERTGLKRIEATKWARDNLDIEVMVDDRETRTLRYPALMVTIEVEEKFVFDRTDTARFHPTAAPGGVDIDMLEAELLVNRAEL